MFGLINVNKPAGMTSRDVVNRIVRRCPRKTKVGHAGTLDPMATGVLVVAIGPATKLIQYPQQQLKTYVGSFRLGLSSDTEDVTGNVSELANAPIIDQQQLLDTLPGFIGQIEQTPPQFSAVKVDGQRAYKAARAGLKVDIKPRPTFIDSISVGEFCYPDFQIEITCGKGTYVRTLGRDIARSLGSDAVMTSLQRTAIGEFSIESAVSLEDIENQSIDELMANPKLMVASMHTQTLQPEEIERLRHGKRLCSQNWDEFENTEIAALNASGQLLAVLERKSDSEFASRINFVPQLY